jgi:predicted phosphodiesterase
MNIAIMADIHGNHIALEACIGEARKLGAAEFLFLGDYLGELAYPERTIKQLERIRKEFPCTFIRGNKENYWIDHQKGLNPDWIWESGSSSTGILKYVYDRLDERHIRWFEQMPISKIVKYPGLSAFVICHGSPWIVYGQA